MNLLSRQTVLMYNHPLTVSNAVLRINTNIIKIHRSMKDIALAHDTACIEEASRIVDNHEENIYKDFDIIYKRFLGEKEKYKKALNVFTEWKDIRDEVISLMHAGKHLEAANITKGKGAIHVSKIEKAMESLGDFAQSKAKDFYNTTEVVKNGALNMMYLLVAVSIALGTAFAIILTKSITTPIAIMRRATTEVGMGNLDTKIVVRNRDEIGELADAFNNMTTGLREITTSRDELDKEITERKCVEEKIKASLKEKEVLLMEIHHRVKNNMQVIASLLRLQSEGIKDKHLLALFEESRTRIKSMALVHEDLYQGKDLARIDFDQYTRKLTDRLMKSFGVTPNRIITNINIDNVFLGIDKAIPCGLIINELFTNSLKYAFPHIITDVEHIHGKDQDRERSKNKGEICINLHPENDGYTLVFSDNGVGLPEDIDFQKAKTLGLELVRTLVKQLKGTIKLNSNGGTEFKITFRA